MIERPHLKITIQGVNKSLGKSTLQFLIAGFLDSLGHSVKLSDYVSPDHRDMKRSFRLHKKTYENRENLQPMDVVIYVADLPTLDTNGVEWKSEQIGATT